MNTTLKLTIFLLIATLLGCGSAGTGVANPPTGSTAKAAAAVAAMFSSSITDSDISAKIVYRVVDSNEQDNSEFKESRPSGCTNDPGCTCWDAAHDDENTLIDTRTYGTAGLYGSTDYSLTIDEEDFCAQGPDGAIENNTTGPDGSGRVASFLIVSDLSSTCTGSDGAATNMAIKGGSTGVFRNFDDGNIAYFPQVFGNMIFEVDGEQVSLDCTLYLSENETVIFSDCSDESGTTVTLDSSATCQIFSN